MGVTESLFIRACYGRNRGRTPIWIMRQAGRYLAEYRAVRKKVSFSELCHSPELIAEVVRQPVAKFDLDAAILFSDILTMLEPMGMKVEFPDGGPRIVSPITKPDDVARLHACDVAKDLSFVLEGIRRIKQVLPDSPLIGFVGSPFTLSCYLIEGKGSKTFDHAKRFLHQYPAAAEKLIETLTNAIIQYLQAQIDAGADAVQVFDSWGGILSRDDYLDWSARPINRIFGALKNRNVPRILFVNNLAPYLDIVRDVDCEVVGVDYRMDIATAAAALPYKSLQGNLEPAVLFGTAEHVAERTTRILDSIDNPDRLIFNLGHGILPNTPEENVKVLVETVHAYRSH